MTHQELQRMNDVISENRSLKQANEELRQVLSAPQREPMKLHQEDAVQCKQCHGEPLPSGATCIYCWSGR